MRVEKKKLGGGLYRLEPVATHWSERINAIPQSVMDNMMRDTIQRMRKEEEMKTTFNPWRQVTPMCNNSCACGAFAPKKRSYEELRRLESMREPDGIDIHVDRPLRENFFTREEWARAMAKYRTLEDVAKDCDWECREPMRGVNDFYQFGNPITSSTYEDNNDEWSDSWEDDDFNWDDEWDELCCLNGRY